MFHCIFQTFNVISQQRITSYIYMYLFDVQIWYINLNEN
jgi:hypothetical protein